jgi:DNA-binding transcriptional LysR family regulator
LQSFNQTNISKSDFNLSEERPMIRLDALRTFVTVAASGNLKEAADQLGRTQSALSMTLKQLEAELEGSLFETDRKRDLTDLGEHVFNVATDMLRDHDRGLDLIRQYAKGRGGRLRLASVPSVAALVLPELLRSFLIDAVDAEIDLVDTDSAAVRKAVASGRADLGIASPGQGMDGLDSELLFSDPLYVICQKGSSLALLPRPLAWEGLVGEALIMNETLVQLDSPGFTAVAARSRLTVRNILSLLAMVGAGAGITILPGLATVSLADGLTALPLADPACSRQVCLLSRSARAPSPLARSMAEHLRKNLPEVASRFGLVTA